jgi:hypothetical protein
MDDASAIEAMLAENGGRIEPSLGEEAEAYGRLLSLRECLTVKSLALRVGRSQSYVRSRLVILALPRRALDELHRGELSLDSAAALAKAADDPEFVDDLLDKDELDVRSIERPFVNARLTINALNGRLSSSPKEMSSTRRGRRGPDALTRCCRRRRTDVGMVASRAPPSPYNPDWTERSPSSNARIHADTRQRPLPTAAHHRQAITRRRPVARTTSLESWIEPPARLAGPSSRSR